MIRHLVVNNNVHGSTSGVSWELGEAKRLVDNTLSGKRCISVEENRDNSLSLEVSSVVLLGTALALETSSAFACSAWV